jgi:hypothetical protein
MFHVQITLAAGDFVETSPVVTFVEGGPLTDASADDVAARILGYSFSAPTSTALTWRLALVPSAAVDIRDPTAIVLEDNLLTGVAGTFFARTCGRDGIIVPRRSGIEAIVQPPATVNFSGETYVLKFETAGMDADGCFHCWYEVGSTQGAAG